MSMNMSQQTNIYSDMLRFEVEKTMKDSKSDESYRVI